MKNRKYGYSAEELNNEKGAAYVYAILVLVTGVAFLLGVIAGSTWFYFNSGITDFRF